MLARAGAGYDSRPFTENPLMRLAPVLALAILAAAPLAQAQSDYPARPIRLVVPFAATGVSDTVARVIAQRVSETIGQQMVVENRGGAGGAIGTELVAKAAPDGYTLVLGSLTTHTIAPHVYKRVGYDALNDFAAISLVTTAPNLIAVNTNVPARSVRDVIALAKAKPGSLAFASSGVGSMLHLAGEMMNSQAGIEMLHIPYKGVALAYPDVFSGQVPVIFDSVISASPHIRAGKIRPLAVTSRTRSPVLPDVPTMQEAGLAGYEMTSWSAIFAPARTPQPVIDRLNREINAALRTPEVRDRLVSVGAEVHGTTPKELNDVMRRDFAVMARAVKSAGITPE